MTHTLVIKMRTVVHSGPLSFINAIISHNNLSTNSQLEYKRQKNIILCRPSSTHPSYNAPRDWRDASTLLLVAKTKPDPLPCTCGCDLETQTTENKPDHVGENLKIKNPNIGWSFRTKIPLEDSTNEYEDTAPRNWSVPTEDFLSSYCNFKTLMLTRSAKSKFMPNALVFPGGVVDEADFDPKWLQLFSKFCPGLTLPKDEIPSSSRPPMFHRENDGKLDPDLAFRICAIRETFEEVGIFLGRTQHESSTPSLSIEETSNWQGFVHKNAGNFLRFCEELQMAPDIWKLHEWSNWLTPIRLKVTSEFSGQIDSSNSPKHLRPRRFDTAFYVATMDSLPLSYRQDNSEIVKAQWLNPCEALDAHYSGSSWMAPPQIYEQSRLMTFESFDDLKTFAVDRQPAGMTRWLPIAVQAKDGVASILPGDSLYPDDDDHSFDFNNDVPPAFNGTLQELRTSTDDHNRFEIQSGTKCNLVCNIEQTNDHVMPLSLVFLY